MWGLGSVSIIDFLRQKLQKLLGILDYSKKMFYPNVAAEWVVFMRPQVQILAGSTDGFSQFSSVLPGIRRDNTSK
jgi:hypothetical protein